MIAVKNGKLITPDRIIEDKTLLIDQDRIFGFADSLDNDDAFDEVINAGGRFIMPGIIDVHSDTIEQYIQPRPTSQMDFEFALKVCERDLLSAGITTMYHSLSLFRDEIFGKGLLRSRDNVQQIADLIAGIRMRDRLIRHRLHLRVEIDNLESFDIVRDMIDQGKAHLISFMDHTPGQGQYSSLAVYQDTISKYNGKEISSLGFDGVLEHHKNKTVLSVKQLKELAGLAHEKGIAVASHDDDTDKKLELNKEIGVDISEFPVSLETAKSAKKHGFYTVVGSANILRNGSHSGNLSATEAVSEECADIICSDYYPAAVLHSIFLMHTKHGVPLPQMVNKATLNPAEAMRTDKDYGSIEPGKKADFLIVDIPDGYPVITHTFVDGIAASRVEYRS
ncbi:MAG: alpha-D-ribose 1-methylphosphonate 5-triphosphate diphosphatase [Oscillospiraceae bacterium]|nr:alpha-D-ribose 1-methylphosphonate 5-triphosphate diphosphatase [Oscillospiraceae bacterium]